MRSYQRFHKNQIILFAAAAIVGLILSTGCNEENCPTCPDTTDTIVDTVYDTIYDDTCIDPISTTSYYFVDYEAGNTVRLVEADLFSDGNFSMTQLVNSEGSLEGGTGVYSIFDDGKVSIKSSDHDIGDTILGATSSDTSIMSFIINHAQWPEEFAIGFKKSNGLTNAALTGDYYIAAYEYNNTVRFAEASLDGNGAMSFQQLFDTDGSLGSGSGSYSVAGDGRLTTGDGSTGDQVVGTISSDGGMFACIGWYPAYQNEIFIGIKKSLGLTNAVLNGNYYVTNYEHGGTVRLAELIFDGQGGLSYQTLYYSAGSALNFSGAYSVASDGLLTLNLPLSGPTIMGVVSSDGKTFTCMEVSVNGHNQLLFGTQRAN